jgi:hypothetical protein
MQISDNPEVITFFDLIPPSPDTLQVNSASCAAAGGTVWVNQLGNALKGRVYSSWSGEPVKGVFTLSDVFGNSPSLPDGGVVPVNGTSTLSSGDTASLSVSLKNGDEYNWSVASEVDGANWGDDAKDGVGPFASSPSYCGVNVDNEKPTTPVLTGVASLGGGKEQLTLASTDPAPGGCSPYSCFSSGVAQFEYSVNNSQFPNNPTATTAVAGDSASTALGAGYTGSFISAKQAGSQGGSPLSTDLCLDDRNGAIGEGVTVDSAYCNGSGTQKWNWDISTLELKINGMCAQPSATATIVLATTCPGGNQTQMWLQGTGGSLVNANDGLCITAPNNTAGTALIAAACTGSSLQNWSNATTTITVTAANWGTNTVWIEAVDTAGNPSAAVPHSFYVPSPPQPGVQGDVTGDGNPDIIAATGDGSLWVYQGITGSDGLQAAGAAGSGLTGNGPANMPSGTTPATKPWNNLLLTHRGSGIQAGTDDLYAYDPQSGQICQYDDSDSTAVPYGPGNPPPYPGIPNPIPVPATAQGTGANFPCTGSSWNSCGGGLTQILAIGDPAASAINPGTLLLNGLLTIENNGQLWYYPGFNSGSLGTPVQLGNTNWGNMTLIAPGYQGSPGQATGQQPGQMLLWARDNSTGALYSYAFTEDGTTWTLSQSGTAAPIDPEVNPQSPQGVIDVTPITLPSTPPQPLSEANYPFITSAGDGAGAASLYLVSTSGNIYVLQGNTDPPDNAHPFTGPLIQLSVPANTTIKQFS